MRGWKRQKLGSAERGMLWWRLERGERADMLPLHAQQLTTGRQQAHFGRFTEDGLGEAGGRVDHVLTTVQHQQHPPGTQEIQQARQRIPGSDGNLEQGGDRALHQGGIGYGAQIDERHFVGKGGKFGMRYGHRDSCLADASRAVQGHEAMRGETRGDLAHRGVPPDHPTERSRQARRRLRRWSDRRLWCGMHCRDRRHKRVATARDVGDVARAVSAMAQGLAQRRQLNAQAALVDRNVGPHPLCQLPFTDDFAGMLDQHDQHVHRPTAESDWLAIPLEKPLPGVQTKGAELNTRLRSGSIGSHDMNVLARWRRCRHCSRHWLSPSTRLPYNLNFLLSDRTACTLDQLAAIADASGRSLLPRASWIAFQTREGVSGMSRCATPNGARASSTACTMVGGAPMVPLSPIPFTPIGLVGEGVSWNCERMFGTRSARGTA